MEEILRFTCDDRISAVNVFEQGVAAMLYDSEEYYTYADTLIFFDRKGNILWEYHYPDDRICHGVKAHILDDMLFISRGEGFIDAFNVKTGEMLWETEVRGAALKEFRMYEDTLYISATDGMFYCFHMDTGDILWAVDSWSNVTSRGGRNPPHIFWIEGDIFYIFTDDGNICAISID